MNTGSRRYTTWREAWSSGAFRRALIIGAAVALVLITALPRFFQWIEARPGIVLHDPMLARWAPREVSVITFVVLYVTLLIVLVSVAWRPLLLLRGLHAYALLLVLRMISMTLLTLEPPADIIPLVDPVTQPFYPGRTPFLKDLFFSGHTATLVLMALLAPTRLTRSIAWLGACTVALLILVQHVHWTVDVLVAPFAAWLAWKGGRHTLRWCGVSVPREEGA